MYRSENSDISNVKKGKKPFRRKLKVSSFHVNRNRVSRLLRLKRKLMSMEMRLIFLNLRTEFEDCDWRVDFSVAVKSFQEKKFRFYLNKAVP